MMLLFVSFVALSAKLHPLTDAATPQQTETQFTCVGNGKQSQKCS